MIYGLYLSATGVLTSSYRQDVIANNLANSETVGFRRDLALFQERLTESRERGGGPGSAMSNPLLDDMTGGSWALPTVIDTSAGEIEPTGNPLDVAIEGGGYFRVENAQKQPLLTRDGRFMVDRKGNLILGNSQGEKILDTAGRPIVLQPAHLTEIGDDGQITQDGKPVAKIGVVDVTDPAQLRKHGANLLSCGTARIQPVGAKLRSGFIERANVDPATELSALMEAQRELEANANMIRYQDQTLGKLVNEVGKIG